MLKQILLATALATSTASQSAVYINPAGTGEVILMPFYTVANGLNTYLNVHNNKNQAKIIRVVLREGVGSQRALSLNVFLSAYDSWTATLGVVDNKAVFLSNDSSCVQAIDAGTVYDLLTQEVDTDPQNPLSPEALLNRVGAGWVEMYEMATVGADQTTLNNAILSRDCEFLNQQYEAGGLWENDLSNQLSPTAGGLHGSVTLIDVTNGAMTSTPAIHLEDFYPEATIAHTGFSDQQPDLASADSTSLLLHQGQAISTVWLTGYEAISALLMNADLTSEFNVDATVAASSDWVLTLPTLRFHQQGTAAPFVFVSDNMFYRFPLPACQSGMTLRSREGELVFGDTCGNITPVPPSISQHAVNVWNMTDSFPGAPLLVDADADNYAGIRTNQEGISEGIINFDFTFYSDSMSSQLDDNDRTYQGLPVIGFAYNRFINANAQPGLLANYGTTTPYRGNKIITSQ